MLIKLKIKGKKVFRNIRPNYVIVKMNLKTTTLNNRTYADCENANSSGQETEVSNEEADDPDDG